MSIIPSINRSQLLEEGYKRINPCETLLDIGCGIMPQLRISCLTHICIEPFSEYREHLIRKASEATDRSIIVINSDLEKACDLFQEKSIDTIVLIDVIEHLPKDIGQMLIPKLEKIATKQIVIFTPLGFFPQSHPNGKDAWGLNGAAVQEHLSGWEPADFGVEWDILSCPDFHLENNLGETLSQPIGAFWAIRNLSQNAAPSKHRMRILDLLSLARKQNNPASLTLASAILSNTTKGRWGHFLIRLLYNRFTLPYWNNK